MNQTLGCVLSMTDADFQQKMAQIIAAIELAEKTIRALHESHEVHKMLVNAIIDHGPSSEEAVEAWRQSRMTLNRVGE